MKKTFVIMVTILLGAISFSSCEKDSLIEDSNRTLPNSQISSTKDSLQLQFANILISGITDSKELREFIKKEALKQFDNDYDVLYNLIKDEIIGDVSISQFLSKYAESKDVFTNIENQLPLLTIHVPTLPNFDPVSWNPNSEIPKLALLVSNSNKLLINDINGVFTPFPYGGVPAFPILVLKMNERVKISSSNLKSENIDSPSFQFIDPCFNPKNNKKIKSSVVTPYLSLDQAVVSAYEKGLNWQRDYVYYGLTEQRLKGKFRPNYCEYLRDFKMNGDWFDKISDQAGDPFANDHLSPHDLKSKEIALHKLWSDGSYEFQIRILINSRNGMGSTITKYFSAKVRDLIEVTSWKKVYVGSPFKFNVYIPQGMKSKYYQPNLKLLSWDLQNYGISWKFLVSEIDLDQEVSETTEITSAYAMNFGITAAVTEKIGLNFGGTATQTYKSNCTIKTKLESDDLGEEIVNFNDPIIIRKTNTYLPYVNNIDMYELNEFTTGWCSFTIVPKRTY